MDSRGALRCDAVFGMAKSSLWAVEPLVPRYVRGRFIVGGKPSGESAAFTMILMLYRAGCLLTDAKAQRTGSRIHGANPDGDRRRLPENILARKRDAEFIEKKAWMMNVCKELDLRGQLAAVGFSYASLKHEILRNSRQCN